MNSVIIYTTNSCPYCVAAKALLNQHALSYQEIDVAQDTQKFQQMVDLTNQRTVPQIIIDGVHIGGHRELSRYIAKSPLKTA
ncbi:MAG TPA: glutaredoxin [Gammaproteobacteria bacterium]|nr:glutaredoxin [Gammaproteobacteria bacterium]